MPRFALLAEPGVAVSALLAAHGELLAPDLLSPLGAGGIWLVRPDGYVAGAAKDIAPLSKYLDALRFR